MVSIPDASPTEEKLVVQNTAERVLPTRLFNLIWATPVDPFGLTLLGTCKSLSRSDTLRFLTLGAAQTRWAPLRLGEVILRQEPGRPSKYPPIWRGMRKELGTSALIGAG